MQAKEASFGFDFIATFTKIEPPHTFSYVLNDQPVVIVTLKENNQGVLVSEIFDPSTDMLSFKVKIQLKWGTKSIQIKYIL